jgi:hypothetical protein
MRPDLTLDLGNGLHLRALVPGDAALLAEATSGETAPSLWGPRPAGCRPRLMARLPHLGARRTTIAPVLECRLGNVRPVGGPAEPSVVDVAGAPGDAAAERPGHRFPLQAPAYAPWVGPGPCARSMLSTAREQGWIWLS